MNLDEGVLLELATRYLERQSWFVQSTASESGRLRLVGVQELSEDQQPGLVRLLLEKGERRVQLFVGSRRASALNGALRNEEAALLGAADDGGVSVVLYDALADDECCRRLLQVATDGAEEALRVRHVASLVSHASLVFDERLFMKCYRVLESGERPEAEVLFGLDRVGFNALIAPVARWQEEGADLALVRDFLPSALEGRLLALTSLRDLLAYVHEGDERTRFSYLEEDSDPSRVAAAAGGDIAGELVRLGETTARLHLALAEAFGDGPLGPSGVPAPFGEDPDLLGRSIRIHGDYHLRRVMRSDAGWLVTGFGDDPLYAVGEQDPSLSVREGSPLEDVADMFFALGQVAREALARRPRAEREEAAPLAAAWRARNRAAFWRGYLQLPGIDALLPSDLVVRDGLLEAFVLERERRYEAMSARR